MNTLTPSEKVQALELIDILEDVKGDIEHFSVYNDDIWDVQLIALENLIKDFRRQL